MTIAEKLKSLRLKSDRTLDDVGSKVGVTKQTLYKYENGIITNIPLEKIEALAHFYNVSPSYIMGWDSDEPTTIAAHHDGEDWTPEELEDIEMFKELLRKKREKK